MPSLVPVHKTFFYLLVFVYELVLVTHTGMCFQVLDFFICTMISNASSQLQILKIHVATVMEYPKACDTLKKTCGVKCNCKTIIQTRLALYVKQHNVLVWYINILERILNKIILVQIFFSVVLISFSLTAMLFVQSVDGRGSLAKSLMYAKFFGQIFSALLQIYVISMNCHDLIVSSDDVANGAYEAQWYNFSHFDFGKSLTKSWLFFLLRSQKLCYLTVGGVLPMSYDIFMQYLFVDVGIVNFAYGKFLAVQRPQESPNIVHNRAIIHHCLRDCTEDPEPRACYYKFHLEYYTSNNNACQLCRPNPLTQLLTNCQCILGDGVERHVKVVNRMIPGPSIQVCKRDEVIVDVENRMEGEDAAIHWHGIWQNNSQYYDGVPFVTQCPIPSGNTFRYRWHADKPGTHWWHSHTGLQEMDGVFGSLIIREAKDPHEKLYDEDLADHVIIVSDWMHEAAVEHFPGNLVNNTGQTPRTFLINGMGWNYKTNSTNNLSVFDVEPGVRYRFRLINACGSVCPSRLTIQGHKMRAVSTDGNPIHPVLVDAINSFSGERYDFVLKTNQPPGLYWIEVTGLGECGETGVHQVAVLRYSTARNNFITKKPIARTNPPDCMILNLFDEFCPNNNKNLICITDLKSLDENVDHSIVSANATVDHKIYLSFQFANPSNQELFKPGAYPNFLVAPGGTHVRSLINNITSVYPPSPYISQYKDIPKNQICNFVDDYEDHDKHRTCYHMYPITLNSLVELIIVDEVQVPNLSHPFHLHGNDFFVIGMDAFSIGSKNKMSHYKAMKQDKIGRMKRIFGRMPLKDTLPVPRNGYTRIVVRFRAHNPGFWLLHCYFQYNMIIGMHLVFHIGELRNLPRIPLHFPKCGQFTHSDP